MFFVHAQASCVDVRALLRTEHPVLALTSTMAQPAIPEHLSQQRHALNSCNDTQSFATPNRSLSPTQAMPVVSQSGQQVLLLMLQGLAIARYCFLLLVARAQDSLEPPQPPPPPPNRLNKPLLTPPERITDGYLAKPMPGGPTDAGQWRWPQFPSFGRCPLAMSGFRKTLRGRKGFGSSQRHTAACRQT